MYSINYPQCQLCPEVRPHGRAYYLAALRAWKRLSSNSSNLILVNVKIPGQPQKNQQRIWQFLTNLDSTHMLETDEQEISAILP